MIMPSTDVVPCSSFLFPKILNELVDRPSIFAIFLTKQWQFWLLAVLVGMFQGGIQSLSRSYFTKIIPLEKSGEYFGLMDVCGKGASFLGTTVVGVLSQATGQINLSLGALSVFFMLGIVFFRMSEKREG